MAANGIVRVGEHDSTTGLLAGYSFCLEETDQHLLVFDDQGASVTKYRWPRPGIKCVGSGGPLGRQPRMLYVSEMS